MEYSCYLCGQPILPHQLKTGDHVVPVVFLGKKQPKTPGFDYAGRIPTHQACNNHFSDETFFRQAMHLVELFQTSQVHGALQNSQHPDVKILPVTTDQVPLFTNRDFKRFNFIDTRDIEIETLSNPIFYADKTKTNLLKVAIQAAMTVKAKSASALLVKRQLKHVPAFWRIFATPFDAVGSPNLSKFFNSGKPFGPHTRASMLQAGRDEWLIAYQHRRLLTFLFFVFHEAEVDPRRVLDTADCEIHKYSANSLNDLAGHQWHLV
jgi:hypothetical protein